MRHIMTNRRLVIATIILSCLTVSTSQYVAAEKAEIDKVKTVTKGPAAQKVIDQWKVIFPDQPYVCWAKESPWKNLNELQAPPKGVKTLGMINLDMGKNEYESTSFVLTNLSDKPMKFKITSAPSAPEGMSTTLRKGVWVIAQDGEGVNDALALIDDDKIKIPAGQSREIWITLKSNNVAAGKYKQTIKIMPKGLKAMEVNIAVKVHNVSLPKRMPLDTYYWGYLTPREPKKVPAEKKAEEIAAAKKAKQMIAAKMADLKSHYVTTPTIHPSIVPRFEFDEKGELITDYTYFDKGMDMFEAGLGADKYVFEMLSTVYFEPVNKPGYPGAKGRPKFLSPKWKAAFPIWLKGWVAHMKSRGMGYDEYYLSPYDERLDDSVYQLCKLIKETDPNVQVHTNALGSVAEIKKIAPYVDVWAPLLNHWLPIGGLSGAISQTVSLKPDTKYSFSFWGKDGSSTMYWNLVFNGSMPGAADMVGSTQWKQYTRSFTTATNTTKVTMNFYPAVGNGTILVDDVILKTADGPNMVSNGDMEISTTSPPYGWSVNKATTTINTTDPHSGGKSVTVTSIPKGGHPGKEAIKEQVASKPSLLWTYANPQGVLPSKADPYKYYRMAIWQTWNEGMTGFGYWTYCGRGAWNYVGKKPGWSVVYNSTLADTPPQVSKKELIVPGKRWEATREGIEDYAYLYLLKQAIGKASPQDAAKAKKLLDSCVEDVLKNDSNPQLAAKAKKQIMEELVKMSKK
jgi:hypothetical protein